MLKYRIPFCHFVASDLTRTSENVIFDLVHKYICYTKVFVEPMKKMIYIDCAFYKVIWDVITKKKNIIITNDNIKLSHARMHACTQARTHTTTIAAEQQQLSITSKTAKSMKQIKANINCTKPFICNYFYNRNYLQG